MEIQEIKIDGIVYVPTNSFECKDCALGGENCVLNHGVSLDITVCNIFEGHALKEKEG